MIVLFESWFPWTLEEKKAEMVLFDFFLEVDGARRIHGVDSLSGFVQLNRNG